ncbi:hypothetical protein ACQCVB_17395 [Fictibacillus phosphorivorans]|uniref:hypothetical protein n=1 Tax=Fictibacillus phosphorivorans TaxID=1221500 RepID=UPI003CF55918
MELLFVLLVHFFIMGAMVLLISGVLTWFLQQIHFSVIVLICMASGYLYTVILEITAFAWFVILYNGVLSLLGVGLVKLGLHMKQKADNIIT